MKKTIMLLSLIIALWATGSIAFPEIIRVPADHPTIQAGIDTARDGDTVLVADGVYFGEGNRNISFKGKAITVRSENGPETTIIHCQNTDRGFEFANGETELSLLTGFTIKDGVANEGDGGGVRCVNTSPTIANCIITQNILNVGHGGGIFCHNSSPTITNCVITENSIGQRAGGGGIYLRNNSSPTITNCIIAKNSATGGGGISCLIPNLDQPATNTKKVSTITDPRKRVSSL